LACQGYLQRQKLAHESLIACLDVHETSSGSLLALFSQSEQCKTFQKALIGWKKGGPPKVPLVFGQVKRLIVHNY